MSDEHNIDRLFQESFKDFEVDAPKNAWSHIEKQLIQKPKKPVIPLWQKLSGVAAAVGILILIGSQWLFNPANISTDNPIVDTPQNSSDSNTPIEQNRNSIITNPANSDDIKKDFNSPEVIQNTLNNPVVVLNGKPSPVNSNANNSSNLINQNTPNDEDSNSILASTDNNKSDSYSEVNNITNTKTYLAILTIPKFNTNAIKKDKPLITARSINNNLIKTPQTQKKSLVEVAQNINADLKDKPKNSDKAWHVKPQISPVYYGNFGSGNAVDNSFAENSSQGEVNMSYGVSVAYELNDKFKLRTGVNRVNLNHTTKDVFLVPNEGSASLSNVNTTPNFNASVLNSQQLENLNNAGGLNRIPVKQSNLTQELGFIEIPMEIQYKLLDKKIDINLVGGASTLLLNNNNLNIENINGTTSIGEVNNLNNLSFSTNFAIGLDYDISERFIFNIEPTFKYQFNTFKSGTTDFQPYFLGIYSGVIFKF